MNWGLSERDIALLRATFAAHPNVQRAVLYGSRAMGTYRPGSDIDLTLEGDLHLQDINRLLLDIDDLLLPYQVDLSAFQDIDNPALVDHIQREGVEFWRR
ncbi:MAG: nucleotidyltransferase domain-containing protein [Bacterioplanes sp.]|nr:nucleotidyltransferase domain-containing protein [Bacterioplanes sp.]